MLKNGSNWNLVLLQISSTKGGMRGACWKLWDQTKKRDNLFSYLILHQKPTNKLVSTPLEPLLVLAQAMGNTDSFDSPRLELGGSHHLLPYSILCVIPPHPHPNGLFVLGLPRWSLEIVLKLSWFGLPGFHEVITLCSNLRSGWSFKQTCSSPWDLSNGVSHSPCTHRGQINSQLLVVGSQIANLTPGPSFAHNLCFQCPNGPCELIFDIYTFVAFQWYKEHHNARCFDPCNPTLKFRESTETPKSRKCECHPHTLPKVGLRQEI
jgi:hypothetical protein